MQSSDRAVQADNARRKQNRILQVREQSKEIAAKLRKRISDERERQKDHVEKVKIDELRKWRDDRVCEQQYNYDRIIGSTIDANEEARREMEANFQHNQRKQELDLIAAQRGRTALRKEISENRPKPMPAKKPKSRTTEVQTDHISFAEPRNNPEPNTPPPPREYENLPPESVNHEAVISDRSVDILTKSKQFVQDANRRLDEISAKVAQCANRDMLPEKEDVPVAMPRRVSPQKTVKTNNTTRLRCDLNRKPIAPPAKVVNRPKKVIPSAKESTVPAVPPRVSVVCYDHPNRFTKTYDIPKNVVVRNVCQDEDDAVTNALNETLTNIEQEVSMKARSKELRQKEAIRELEAMEKSQVRRDYEMLAKTLDEVRKTHNASPSQSSTTGYQYVNANGSVSLGRLEASQNIPISTAFNDVLHLPIRISCPKISQAAHLNVGETTDRDNFSGSDSAKSILLDQLMTGTSSANEATKKEKPSRQPQVVVENNVPNVKVRTVTDPKGGDGTQPMKIIIQVENMPRSSESLAKQTVALYPNPKSGLYTTVNESLSTNYMSPPSEINTQMDRFLKPKQKTIKPSTRTTQASNTNPNLKAYITKLLQMPQIDVEKLTDNDVSDINTPSNSILNVRSNVTAEPIYDEQKLSSVSRIIEDNYSILEEVDELIAQNSRSERNSEKVQPQSQTPQSTDSLIHRYAAMSQTYNDRIHSLNNMIKVIRAEKQSLMQDNGLSNVTTSERDTSTKYKDFGSMARTITPSGSELSNDSGEILSGSHQIKKQAGSGKSVRLGGANKVIGLSRDSGISMSRPVTSTEVRENPEEKGFEPMLKDIPRHKPLEVAAVNGAELLEKKRPPNSIARYSPEAIQAAGHDLSTIIEVDTPGTVHVALPPPEPMPAELKRFPTLEEFVNQNGTNVSMLSETDRAEVVPVKPFVSFNQFVGTNQATNGNGSNEVELNLSEIADELRRRSLLAENNAGSDGQDDDDEKRYMRSLSRELEDMIQRINSQGLKEPINASQISLGSFKSIASDAAAGAANETTIGNLLEQIQPNRFPTREQFNLQNNSKHYKSSEVLKSFLNGTSAEEIDGGRQLSKSPQKQQPTQRDLPSEARGSRQGQTQSSGSGSNKIPSDSLKSQTLNLSEDLMNALENNLSEMGLKWAVNMLKRSHLQTSSTSSRGSSSSENVSKEAIPFESKTMSLLTDLEKSSISDESKTSNIKNIILRELIRNRSGNSSSNGSLSSSNIGRRLLNADGSGSDDGRCLRTSTPVHSNLFNSVTTTSTLVDKGEKTVTAVDTSDCLFSGESKLSSVRDDLATLSSIRLNVPEMRLDMGKYARPTDSTLSTEYSLNEHNKRKMNRGRVNE